MRKRRRKQRARRTDSAAIFEDKAKINGKLAEIMMATGDRSLKKRAADILKCGSTVIGVLLKGDGSGRVCRERCNLRPCASCDAVKSALETRRLSRRVTEELKSKSVLLFWTPTMRHTIKDSLWALRKAYKTCWKRLTNTTLWKEVAAYFRRAEVERNRNNGWNAHFHVLLKLKPGSRLSKLSTKKLQEKFGLAWLRLTSKVGRPSPVTRLKRVRNKRQAEGVVMELVKYVTKQYTSAKRNESEGVGACDYTPAEMFEYVMGMNGWNVSRYGREWRARNRAERLLAKKEFQFYGIGEIGALEAKLISGTLTREEAEAVLAARRAIQNLLRGDGLGWLADELLGGRKEWIDRATGEIVGG